jgi:hypothetical protein
MVVSKIHGLLRLSRSSRNAGMDINEATAAAVKVNR